MKGIFNMITLTDNDMIIAQDMFDIGTVGVINQGCQSLYEGICKYRLNSDASNNIRCAIGHCIADKDYYNNMEGILAGNLSIFNSYSLSIKVFMGALQNCHDNADIAMFVVSFYHRCKRLAIEYDLDTTMMDNAYKSLNKDI